MPPHHYTLKYFDIRALGEPIRLLLHYTGEKFQDERIQPADWPDFKPKTPFGKLPILEIDNSLTLTQSSAIARYFADKHHLSGKDDWEKAKVNELIDVHKDFFQELIPYILHKVGIRPMKEHEKHYDETFLPGLKRILPVYEKLLKKSGSGYVISSGLTYVDFFIADFLHTLETHEPKVFGEHPDLHEYVERVYHSKKEVQEHVEGRKESPI